MITKNGVEDELKEKRKMKTKWIYFGCGLILGILLGTMLIYKVEINTINQALDSLSYCYETYALGK